MSHHDRESALREVIEAQQRQIESLHQLLLDQAGLIGLKEMQLHLWGDVIEKLERENKMLWQKLPPD